MNLTLNTSELQKLDSQHFIHPFTDPKALQKKGARVITRAEGIYLWDILAGASIVQAAGGKAEILNMNESFQVDVVFSNSNI